MGPERPRYATALNTLLPDFTWSWPTVPRGYLHVKAYRDFARNPWELNIHGTHLKKKKNPYRTVPIHKNSEKLLKSRGGTRIIFWRSVRPKVWNPYPYLRSFSHPKKQQTKTKQKQKTRQNKTKQKNGWIDSFFPIFRKLRPICKGFSISKWLILQFFTIFVTGPSSKYFFKSKWDPYV